MNWLLAHTYERHKQGCIVVGALSPELHLLLLLLLLLLGGVGRWHVQGVGIGRRHALRVLSMLPLQDHCFEQLLLVQW